MKKIDSIHDYRDGFVTYEFTNGQMVRLDRRDIEMFGLDECLRAVGAEDAVDAGRVKVMQDRQLVGTVPETFDPDHIQSKSQMYEPRRGDFRREGADWVADPMLGLGDFLAIPGFRPA